MAASSDSTSARADDVEGAERAAVDAARGRRRVERRDVDARAHAHLDQALDLERDQRLAHRGPRHAELCGEVALGRQARAERELAGRDQPAQLVRDLAVQACALDGVQRHGVGGYWPTGLTN
jgi:hypothetical protein